MNKYFQPTGTSSPTQARTRQQLNDDIRKLVAQRQKGAEQQRINLFVENQLKNPIETSIQNKQVSREVAGEAAVANLSPDEQESLLGRVGNFLDLGGKHVARPLMASGLASIFAVLPGEQEGEAELRKATGLNPLNLLSSERREAGRKALEETDLPWGVYTAMETLLDPTTYIPIPGARIASRGIRSAAKLEKTLAAQAKLTAAQKRAQGSLIFKEADISGVSEGMGAGAKLVTPTGLTKPIELTRAQKIAQKITKAPDSKQVAAGRATSAIAAAQGTKIGRLLDIDERMDQTITEDNARQAAEWITKKPILKNLVGAMNPSTLAKTSVGRVLLGHGVLLADGEKYAAIATAKMQAIRKMAPKSNDQGMILHAGGTGKGIDNLGWADIFEETPAQLEKRVKLGQLTKENVEYISEYKAIIDDASQMLKEANPEKFAALIKDIADPGKYIPKFVRDMDSINKFSKDGYIGGILSKKKAFEYKKYYDTMADGIADGRRYLDPEDLLAMHLRGVYRTVADEKLVAKMRGTLGRLKSSIAPTQRLAAVTARARFTTTKNLVQLMNSMQADDTFEVSGKQINNLINQLKDEGTLAGDTEMIDYVNRFRSLLRRGTGPIDDDAMLKLDKRKKASLSKFITELTSNTAAKNKTPNDVLSRLGREQKAASKVFRTQYAKERGDYSSIASPKGGVSFGKDVMFDKNTKDAFIKNNAKTLGPDWAKKMATGNAIARMGATGFDFGAGTLQGLPLLVTNPVGWGRAQLQSIYSLFDPTAMAQYIRRKERTLREMGIDLKAAEFVEAWGDDVLSTPRKLLRKLGPAGRGLDLVGEAASRAFTGFTLAARVELYEGLRPVALRAAQKKGMNISDHQVVRKVLDELSDHVAKMTGFTNMAKLGVTPGQANVERSFLFAPRYLRATTGATADIFNGGIRGNLARTTLAKMLAGGTLMYTGIASAVGQEPDMNPTSPGFLSVDIAGTKFGFGSAWVSGARTLAKIAQQPLDYIGDTGEIKKYPGDEDSFLGNLLDPNEHILGRYTRSKTSPLVGLGWDIALGKDFNQDAVDPLGDPLEFLKDDLAGSIMPFWAQGLISTDRGRIDPDQPVSGKMLQAGSEFLGLRSNPVGFFQQRSMRQDALAKIAFGGKSWDDLTSLEKGQLNDQDETLKVMTQQIRHHQLDSMEEVVRAGAEYRDERDKLQLKKEEVIQTDKWRAGEITPKEWRDALKLASNNYRASHETLSQQANYAVAISNDEKYFQENQSGYAIDEAFGQYIEEIVVGGEDENGISLYDDLGNLDYDKKEERLNEFKQHWDNIDPSIYQSIMSHFASNNKDKDPILQRYYQAQETFERYWETEDLVVKNAVASGSISQSVWDEYKNARSGGSTSEVLKEQYPAIKQIENFASKAKQALRTKWPALDAYLYQFQYTQALLNPSVKILGKELLEDPDFDPFTLPMN